MIKNYTLEDFENIKTVRDAAKIKENKELYGEVHTPFHFVNRVLSIIPEKVFENPSLKWLDPGSGTGNFSIVLYFKLVEGLKETIPDLDMRKNHIIKNMIYMAELRPENTVILKDLFGDNANIYEGDFLGYNSQNSQISQNSQNPLYFDVIIGNPPFNNNGLKKVPTNNTSSKKQDGNTIWMPFVIKSISLLTPETGILCMFIPSIWLKPDKGMMYDYLIKYDITSLNCISNTETNKIFRGNAQTPSCYFLLRKRETNNIITIFDNNKKKYIDYYLNYGKPIPVFGQEIIKKLQKYCIIKNSNNEYINNAIYVYKTNVPPIKTVYSPIKTEECKYPNISTCKFKSKTTIPELIINYSNNALQFSNLPKLILAHKMYGFPYLDKTGQYGISSRDNYVILKEKMEDLVILQKFLSTNTALYLFEATRYRMKYLERYAFQLIPDITRFDDFPKEINDDTIADYFQFDDEDRKNIQNLHKKKYTFF
jgi:hypothetical protein